MQPPVAKVTKLARVGEPVLAVGKQGRIFSMLLDSRNVYFYFEGQVELWMFDASMAAADAALASGQAFLHGDGEHWKSYAAEYRHRWTDWFGENRPRIAHVNLLIRSPILRMGVQVVNLFTQDVITPLADPNELYASLRRQAPGVDALVGSWPSDIAARMSPRRGA